MRILARVVILVLLALFATAAGPTGPAVAVTKDVSISGFAFNSASVTVGQGTTVRWTNNDGTTHSVQSNQGFFSSPNLGSGAVYTHTAAFKNAGSYRYHCRQHPVMSGVVRVRMRKSGSPSNGWTIRWSSLASNPNNRTFDVQVKRPGSSSFQAFRTNTHNRSAFFNPSRNGTYAFRARTDIGGQSSGFSPAMSLSIS